MMCYKDMTFCPFYDKCRDGKSCDRALTDKVVADSVRYDMPISRFVNQPDCFMEITNEQN
jgi:hypothetical protein